jgi:hypothetical protein
MLDDNPTNEPLVILKNLRDGILLKIQRAEKHINDFHVILDTFKKTNPYRFVHQRDSQTGRLSYYVTHAEDIPPEIPIIAGKVFNSLRSALEYLVYDMIVANGGTPTVHAGFPIYDDPAKFQAGLNGKVKVRD